MFQVSSLARSTCMRPFLNPNHPNLLSPLSSLYSRLKSLNHLQNAYSSFALDDVLSQPEKLLLTPGPLSTSNTVKQCLARDFGSRDQTFIDLVSSVRNGILDVAGVSPDEYTCILVQGSGTFSVEATIGTLVPRGDGGNDDGKLLVITNGAYADRAIKIAKYYGINTEVLRYVEDTKPSPKDVDRILSEHADRDMPFSTVFMVHSETTSGLVNPIESVGDVVNEHGADYIVDAMSSFGGIPIDFSASGISALVTSANKCIQGVPGFGIAIVSKEVLSKCEGRARSLSLDLFDQERGLSANGQFRFTPPTHTICAFQKALDELKKEGGVIQRYARYNENKRIACEVMNELGFELYLSKEDQGPIISSFKYPDSPHWDFETFYEKLAARDVLIYPGKVTNADCFRIGHIGHIYPKDMERVATIMKDVCEEMGLGALK